MRKLFLSYNQLTELFAHIFGKTVEGGVIPGQIVKDLARWRIIFILKIVSQYMKLNICKVFRSLQCKKYFPHMSLSELLYMEIQSTSWIQTLRKTAVKINDTTKGPHASTGLTLNFNPLDRFQPKKRNFQGYFFFIILFRLNVASNYRPVILRRCLDVTGSSMLTLRMLPHWHITPQTHDVKFHPVTLYWHRTNQFRFLNAERKRKGS